jgi:hypothetical protein
LTNWICTSRFADAEPVNAIAVKSDPLKVAASARTRSTAHWSASGTERPHEALGKPGDAALLGILLRAEYQRQ